MAKLSLFDAFGFTASGNLKPGGSILRLLPQFPHLQSIPLDEIQVADAGAELTFKEPLSVAVPGLSISIGAGAGGHFRIIGSDKHLLDRDDPFNAIRIDPNEIFLALELTCSLTQGANIRTNPLAFGFSLEQDFTITSYRRFFRSDAGLFPSFGTALASWLQAFVLPQSRDDLEQLDRDTILVLSGTGSFSVSTSFAISTSVQQLAASSPIAGKVVEVNASASISTGFTATSKGFYQTRLQRLDAQGIEIGIYKGKSGTLTFNLSAGAGLAVNLGSFDLAEKFISALSPNPTVDIAEFKQALPGEDVVARDLQIAAFEEKLAAAISTRIAVSLDTSFSELHSNESAITFRVDLDRETPDSTVAAVTAALSGDFTALTRDKSLLPPGVAQTSNVFTTTDLTKAKLNINLLGIVNFVSLGKLARIAEVTRNADGEITLVTDTSDANRLQAVLLNAAGNAKRLGAMLSEDFLFQATYRAVDLKVLPPEFTAKHTYINIDSHTSRQEMKNILDVCRVMGMLTPQQEASRLNGDADFGRTTLWLQAVYSNAAIEQTFLDARGLARRQEDFETCGRQTLGRLLEGDAGQEFRKLLADLGPQGNGVWEKLRQIGNPGLFNEVFGLPLGASDPRVSAAAADFVVITRWAEAMTKLADAIVDSRRVLAGSVSPDSGALQMLRSRLRDRMADVVSHSGEHFGEPLGLVTVFLASGSSASARVILAGPSIPLLSETTGPNLSSNRAAV